MFTPAPRPSRRGARSILLRLCSAIAILAMTAATCLAQSADRLARAQSELQAENEMFAARLVEGRRLLEVVEGRLARARTAHAELDATMARIESYTRLPGLGAEFVQTVMEELRTLPQHPTFLVRAEREREAVVLSDENLRAQRALRALDDLDAAALQRVHGTPRRGEHRPDPAVVRLLSHQHELLTALIALQQEALDKKVQVIDAERAMLKRADEARGPLLRMLFWIPVRPGLRTIGELDDAVMWSIAPAHWSEAWRTAADEFVRAPVWPALALLVAVVLATARRWLATAIGRLAPATVGPERYGLRHTFLALGATVGLALPLALAMHTVSLLLHGPEDSAGFVRALGDTLHNAAPLMFALSATAWLLDRRGIGATHFGWDAAALGATAETLRRFTVFFMPVIMLAALNGLDHAPFANRESLGRVLIAVSTLMLAALLARVLRMRSPLMQLAARHAPRSWPIQLHAVWFLAVLAVPLGVALLSLTGYFLAAGYFVNRIVRSFFFAAGALLLYGLVALWVQVERAGYARRAGASGGAPAGASPAPAGGISLPAQRPLADIAALGEQTRALLDVGVTLLLLVAMWWVWGDSLPVLSQIGDYVLWTYTETVDEKHVTKPITVGSVFAALLIAGATAIVVRNIGALLDILLLQRLDVQPDASYAVKVTARYVLAACGIMLAASSLGIGWSDVQWLVAALGVGLGFGLQEIFGNFVAGIIVLVERPVRIGDVVTIGDVSGTVTKVQARVITLVDFDNKEVLIPNKSLITDRVTNWTLSSQTTRLLLKVSVANDCDLALAQRVMIEALEGNPDVLRDPPPRVFFVGFGSGANVLEVNAFVGSFAKRQRVQHEIYLAIDEALKAHGIRVA